MTSERTDTHRPQVFDPADYEVIDYLDGKQPPYFMGLPMAAYEDMVANWRERILHHFPDWKTGGTDHTSVFQCNHCGQHGLRWIAVVLHKPTGAKLAFGDICANRVELPGRDAFRVKFIKDRAARELAAAEKAAARAKFTEANADVVEFLAEINTDYDSREPEFLISVAQQLSSKGELSDGQVNAVRKFIARRDEFAARKAEEAKEITADFPEGRQTVTGEIISTKVQTSDYYPSTFKMLVRLTDGNKVWGTVPSALEDLTFSTINDDNTVTEGIELKGTTITFTASFERSNDDLHFGFFKRPTKVSVAEAVSA